MMAPNPPIPEGNADGTLAFPRAPSAVAMAAAKSRHGTDAGRARARVARRRKSRERCHTGLLLDAGIRRHRAARKGRSPPSTRAVRGCRERATGCVRSHTARGGDACGQPGPVLDLETRL